MHQEPLPQQSKKYAAIEKEALGLVVWMPEI